jgi:branched-chain amino acid transport system substrate-binding protein
VQTKTYDDQAEAAQEPVVFRKLAQDKIHYAIGPISSTANLAAAPIATSSKILQLSVCIADQITDASKYPYAYVIGPTNSQAVQAMVNYAKTQNWKKIVLLHEDSAYGTDPIGPLQTAATAAGMTVTMIQHPAMTTNMAPYVGKVKDADPDVVIIFQEILATEVAMFTAFDNLNYNPPKMGTQGSGTKSVITSIPAAQVSTLLVTSWQNFSYPAGGSSASIPPNSLAYVNKVKDKLGDFGGLTIAGLAYGIYDFPFMLQAAIKQAGSQDPDKVRAVLDSMPAYEGVIGKIKFSSTNHNGLDASEFAICKAASASSANSVGGYILERA